MIRGGSHTRSCTCIKPENFSDLVISTGDHRGQSHFDVSKVRRTKPGKLYPILLVISILHSKIETPPCKKFPTHILMKTLYISLRKGHTWNILIFWPILLKGSQGFIDFEEFLDHKIQHFVPSQAKSPPDNDK